MSKLPYVIVGILTAVLYYVKDKNLPVITVLSLIGIIVTVFYFAVYKPEEDKNKKKEEDKPVVANENKTPLENRITREAIEIDNLIEYFTKVRKSLNYKEITMASQVFVKSQEVIKAAEHARIVGMIKKKSVGIDSRINHFIDSIKRAGKDGYYAYRTSYMDLCMGMLNEEHYKRTDGSIKDDYYESMMTTVYMLAAIRVLQRKGYTFRTSRRAYDIFICSNENVPDSLKLPYCDQESYKASEDIEGLLNDYNCNAKVMYAQFPELFSEQLKRDCKVGEYAE